jgi:hypothetical protein
MKASTAAALTILASLALAGVASTHTSSPRSDPARGLVYAGVERARPDGSCKTARCVCRK